ncbi:prepilin peptidase [Ferrimonas marina]|uniref:Prepilin leader peptidase/N-methyltransferase n=1 Tax=Ferrimonas marina TaxID=299255 RepID=A0A1M5XF36_9GAMM|nr:A24 family peptidase [Ferrimonas marina]SHH98430.1 leader peptidase (prepilin peptidase) / N-methyltransferase [Ferrimonas marina]
MAWWLESFTLYPALFFSCVFLVSLLLGSFLNVVIHRLPIMMEREWKLECAEALELSGDQATLKTGTLNNGNFNDGYPAQYNLVVPGSACPHCGTAIPAWRNIPLISYLAQKGRCHQCAEPISVRYPLVELATALLCTLVAWQLGPTPQFLAAWLLTLSLVALSAIDLDKMLLPDQITLPLLWLGLLLNIDGLFASLSDAVLGAAVGYLSLWSVFQGFKLLTGKEGMGYGDFKLLALFGAWFGWQAILPIILLASVGGAVVGITLMATGKLAQGKPMPFGPWIALGGFIYLLWGPQLVSWYLSAALGA